MMKKNNYNVWLVRSPEVSKIEYWNVFNLLKSIPGVINYLTKEEKDFDLEEEENKTRNISEEKIKHTWFFEQCRNFRDPGDVGNKDMVIYLTDFPNENSLFLKADDDNILNAYVQTSEYDKYFPGSDTRYPIAYHIAVTVLMMQWFENMEDALKTINMSRSKGGILDFCSYKKDVILKLRTADLSAEEIDSLVEKKVDPNLILTVLETLEKLRSFMLLKNRWGLEPKPLVMTVNNKENQLYFEELGNIAVNLTPVQLALYLTFLTHTDGIIYDKKKSHLEFGDLMYVFYDSLKSDSIDIMDPGFKDRIALIEKTWKTNDFSIQLSKIKKEFIKALGSELAKLYYITDVDSKKRNIALNRDYIEIVDWKGKVLDKDTYFKKFLDKAKELKRKRGL
jgi:hypothetical protein